MNGAPTPVPGVRNRLQRPLSIALGFLVLGLTGYPGTLLLVDEIQARALVRSLVDTLSHGPEAAAVQAFESLKELPESRLKKLIPHLEDREQTPLESLSFEEVTFVRGGPYRVGEVVEEVLRFRMGGTGIWIAGPSTPAEWAAAWDGLVAAKDPREAATP